MAYVHAAHVRGPGRKSAAIEGGIMRGLGYVVLFVVILGLGSVLILSLTGNLR